ncbi:hypothetical protein MA6G0125S_5451 [Mycobacteroides abscessus 6G-0125-S]|nr:hypothetical protein MA6G0125S_5451 [Mycobacteroides abscessus 6G-0125-S]EIU64165.1 hypothetical protein MA6G0728S_5282 [Mycobacteroides abscessus 6G-0728-S]
MVTVKITDRALVRAGDRVTWGALGYIHEGIARSDPDLWDGQLAVNGGIDWWANFLCAERD